MRILWEVIPSQVMGAAKKPWIRQHQAGALLAGAVLSLGVQSGAGLAQAGINGPSPGVICDQSAGICYDRQGPSIGLTQTYLGSLAAGRLTDALRTQPAGNAFQLSNGVLCDLPAASCWNDGWNKTQLSTTLTQQLFGSLPAPLGGLQGLQTPAQGIVCDPAGQVCYDQAGLSMGLTRQYYGALAEQTVLRNLNGQAAPKQFRLSEGSACDVLARTCWSDGWNRQRVNVALSSQLFGGGGASGAISKPSPGGGTVVTSRPANCRITRWFKVLYSGTCTVQQSNGNRLRNLNVQLQDGSTFAISRQRGSYQLTDAQGTSWPLQVRDQGATLSFIWSDRILTVTPQGQPSNGINLGQLINSLLGQ